MAYSPALYMHDLDKKAFDALNMFPNFVKLQEAYITNVDEKAAKIEFLSTAIRLSGKQMPEIYTLLPSICEKLGIVTPDLYSVHGAIEKQVGSERIYRRDHIAVYLRYLRADQADAAADGS